MKKEIEKDWTKIDPKFGEKRVNQTYQQIWETKYLTSEDAKTML